MYGDYFGGAPIPGNYNYLPDGYGGLHPSIPQAFWPDFGYGSHGRRHPKNLGWLDF